MYSPEWEQRLDTLPRGFFFTAVISAFVAVALFFALLYRDWTMTLFTLILLIFALGLRIWRRLAAKELKFSVVLDKEKVFPGEKIDLQVRAVNQKFLPVFIRILLSLPASLKSDAENAKDHTRAGGLLWFQKMAFHRDLFPQRRGVYSTGAVRLITGDYFGFFPKALGEAVPADILVFPQLFPVKRLSVLTPMLFGKKAKSSPIHDPVDILGTRDYRAQSPARHIHWKASARHYRLQEKIYDMTKAEKVFILFDADGFVTAGDRKAFEHALSVIGSLAFELSRNHYKLGFMTNCFLSGQELGLLMPERKPGFLSHLFETLARIDFRTACAMNQLLENMGPGRESCLYFSHEPLKEPWFAEKSRTPLVNIISRDSHEKCVAAAGPRIPLRSIDDICQVV
jgi:uncharacterized protein (DUF58 family)